MRNATRVLCTLLILIGFAPPAPADEAKAATAIVLAARSGLPDPFFRDSVVLVMNNLGPAPIGFIVNRPTKIAVAQLFPDIERLAPLGDKLYFGGPVEPATVWFLFRADKPPGQVRQVMDGLYLGADPELLRVLLNRESPMDGLRIVVGYAGWAPGQLEAEIARGDWRLAPARPEAIFNPDFERPWPEPKAPDGARPT